MGAVTSARRAPTTTDHHRSDLHTIFELLEQYPEGIRWAELNAMVEASDPSLNPKTINGCVWRLVEKYPERVYKPSKGVFRLTKHRDADADPG